MFRLQFDWFRLKFDFSITVRLISIKIRLFRSMFDWFQLEFDCVITVWLIFDCFFFKFCAYFFTFLHFYTPIHASALVHFYKNKSNHHTIPPIYTFTLLHAYTHMLASTLLRLYAASALLRFNYTLALLHYYVSTSLNSYNSTRLRFTRPPFFACKLLHFYTQGTYFTSSAT